MISKHGKSRISIRDMRLLSNINSVWNNEFQIAFLKPVSSKCNRLGHMNTRRFESVIIIRQSIYFNYQLRIKYLVQSVVLQMYRHTGLKVFHSKRSNSMHVQYAMLLHAICITNFACMFSTIGIFFFFVTKNLFFIIIAIHASRCSSRQWVLLYSIYINNFVFNV